MIKRHLVLAACAALAISLAAPALAGPLEVIENSTLDATLSASEKITVVFFIGNKCTTCPATERLLEQAADRHPQLRIVKTNTKQWFASDPVGNIIAVSIPGHSLYTYAQDRFRPQTAAQLDAFLAERLARSTEIIEAKLAYAKLDGQVAAAYAPFQARRKALTPQFDAIAKPFDDKIAPLDEQIHAIQSEIDKATEAFWKERNEADQAVVGTQNAIRSWLNEERLEQRTAPTTAPFMVRLQPLLDAREALDDARSVALTPVINQYRTIESEEFAVLLPLVEPCSHAASQLTRLLKAEIEAGEGTRRSGR